MEPRYIVRLLQIHKTVEFRKCKTAYIPKMLGHQVLGQLGQHGVYGDKVYPLRFPGGYKVHLLNPSKQELREINCLGLMKNSKNVGQKPIVIDYYYPVDIGYQSGREAVLESTGRTLGTFVLYEIACGQEDEFLLRFQQKVESILPNESHVLQFEITAIDHFPEENVRDV